MPGAQEETDYGPQPRLPQLQDSARLCSCFSEPVTVYAFKKLSASARAGATRDAERQLAASTLPQHRLSTVYESTISKSTVNESTVSKPTVNVSAVNVRSMSSTVNTTGTVPTATSTVPSSTVPTSTESTSTDPSYVYPCYAGYDRWMFDRAEFLTLNALYGPFTLDAYAADDGCNAQVTKYCTETTQPFLKADISGETVWMVPPLHQVHEFIRHYLACKHRPAFGSLRLRLQSSSSPIAKNRGYRCSRQ